MAAVPICSDFGAHENKICQCFHFFFFYLPWSDGTRCCDLSFLNVEFQANFSLSSLTLVKRLFCSSLLFAVRVVSSVYLRLLIFLLAFCVICSKYKLNKQGDNIQPWCTPFLIWNQSVVKCTVLTVASWPAYKFLKRQVRWSGIPISLRIFHSLLWSTIKDFGLVNKAEVDVFLELSCFFDDPTDVGNLIFGSSAFLNPALTSGSSHFTYCWSLAWRILIIVLLACEMSAIVWFFCH